MPSIHDYVDQGLDAVTRRSSSHVVGAVPSSDSMIVLGVVGVVSLGGILAWWSSRRAPAPEPPSPSPAPAPILRMTKEEEEAEVQRMACEATLKLCGRRPKPPEPPPEAPSPLVVAAEPRGRLDRMLDEYYSSPPKPPKAPRTFDEVYRRARAAGDDEETARWFAEQIMADDAKDAANAERLAAERARDEAQRFQAKLQAVRIWDNTFADQERWAREAVERRRWRVR